MGCFGLLGERLTHSFSPFIHAELGDYEYCLYEKKPEELDVFLKQGNFDGLNVTIPYKKTVIPYCHVLSETARKAGSVNTIARLSDGTLYGDNTDFFGFAYLLQKSGINTTAGKIIILGSGGSSHTVQAVLENKNAKEIIAVSRNGANNYENISKHRDAVMIINTTPVGMYPNNGSSPISDFDIFPRCQAVIDLIYNPARTELLLQAEERGIVCMNGLAMLVAQAKRSAEIFTNICKTDDSSKADDNSKADDSIITDEKIESVISKIITMTRNIVLIGMPGCGKTSIGKALAKMTGRKFADTDEMVIASSGKSVPAIFAEDGEEAFRRLENDALRAVCKESGLIIATGGGIVKNPENRRIIRQNGIIVFLDRDIAELPVSGRPLSEQEGLNALAAARLPLYNQWSECIVPVRGVEQTAADICAKALA